MTVGLGGWVPFGRFVTLAFDELAELPPMAPACVELPIAETWRFLTLECRPGQDPTMTVSGARVELEKAIGRDGALVWRQKS
jgi:hypothetical protein